MDTNTTDPVDQAIAAALRAKKAEKNIQLKQLVERSGVPQRTLQRYLDGERAIPMSKFMSVAHAMGVEAWQIVEAAQHILDAAQQESGVDSRDS